MRASLALSPVRIVVPSRWSDMASVAICVVAAIGVAFFLRGVLVSRVNAWAMPTIVHRVLGVQRADVEFVLGASITSPVAVESVAGNVHEAAR